jgi:S1-C subfamily serine protease
MRWSVLLVVSLLLLVSSAWAVTLYRWTDAKGVVHVSEQLPEGVQGQKMIYDDRKSGPEDAASGAWAPGPVPDQQSGKGPGGEQSLLIGTGFLINDSGYVITNRHVANGCSKIVGKLEGKAVSLSLIKEDSRNDLALLKAKGENAISISLRQGQEIRAGESIVLLGFPFHGLLAQDVNVATGIVSALAGIGDDKRYLQIAAPVQLGNSGGPLLDQSGNLVGVVVGKLDAIKIAKATGDIPQNINFAIKSSVVETFLDDCGVSYKKNASGKSLALSDIVEGARKATMLLECYRVSP